MLKPMLLFYFVLVLCCSLMASDSIGSDAVWVIGSVESIKSHRLFIEDMKKRNYKVVVYDQLNSVPPLFDHLIPSISNVVLLGSKLPKSWTAASVIDYIKQGGHLLNAFGAIPPSTTEDWGLVLNQLGIQSTRFPLRDDFSKNDPTRFSTREFGPAAKAIFSAEVLSNETPIVSSGYGLVLDTVRSKFNVWSVLAPSWTSFATDVDKHTITSESNAGLSFISIFQSHVNSRVAVVASDYFLSDASFDSKATSNRLAARDLADWTFLRRGILRVQGFKYHSENEGWAANDTTVPKKIFRVLDSISVQAGVSMLKEDGSWVPFLADDLQIEFIMLSPYVRRTLEPAKDCQALPPAMLSAYGCLQDELLPSLSPSTYQLYYASSPLPDRVGLFTLRLHYHRPGWLFLDEERLVLMRQYAHNEFPRLLAVCYPYYIMMISMMVGAVFLAILFLYYKPKQKSS